MDRLLEFLKQYVEFFHVMEEKQKEKLESLISGKLEQIEAGIAMQQAINKQMENMERERVELFASLGYGNLTFKEIIDKASDEYKGELQEIYHELEASIGNIKYINQKCMKIADTELKKTGAVRENVNTGQGYSPQRSAQGSLLQRKI